MLLEALELSILCITDDVVRGVDEFFSAGCSFFGLPLTPQLSLFVLSWLANALKLEAELFLRLESKYVVDFIDGLGLGTV